MNKEQVRLLDRGSAAFKIEYEQKFPRQALYKDIESYLGEYRFEVPAYPYQLFFARNVDSQSEFTLCDVDQKESMLKKAQRALQKKQWQNTAREEADLEGLKSLNEQLHTACTGDAVIWTSPPGSKKDGYGDYGFVYIGEIEEIGTTGEKRLYMVAMRIENQTVEQCSSFFSLITGQNYSFTSPEDCVSCPLVLNNRDVSEVERLMKHVFNFSIDPEKDTRFTESMKILNPHIHAFIDLVHKGVPRDQLIAVFHALENYAFELRSQPKKISAYFDTSYQESLNFGYIIKAYGKEKPPVIGGSCGSTETEDKHSNSLTSTSNIFNKYSILQKLLKDESEDKFECPACHKKSDPPVGEQCPHCRITLQEAIQKGIVKKACV